MSAVPASVSGPAPPLRLHGLPALVSPATRLLVLGSFPGAASLASQQYYGHPQNHFWKILDAMWPGEAIGSGANSYQIRSKWMLSKGVGVWDVYASCERQGSLDSAIRQAAVNDFRSVVRLCPGLEAIAHNGAESFRHVDKVREAFGSGAPDMVGAGVQFYRLPSTSPANASWSFERKLAAWRDVFEKHGLV